MMRLFIVNNRSDGPQGLAIHVAEIFHLIS